MTAVPPSEQYRSQYTFLTPDTYYANYLSVIHPVGALLELDGISVSPGSMGTRGLRRNARETKDRAYQCGRLSKTSFDMVWVCLQSPRPRRCGGQSSNACEI